MKISNSKECSIPFENDGRYTKEMYRGNIPSSKGGKYIVNGSIVDSECWRCRFGGGDVVDGKVMFGTFYLNTRVSISIIYDVVEIIDIRWSCKFDEFIYRSDGCISGSIHPNMHSLEQERLEEYVFAEVEDCKFWGLFKKRVIEIIGDQVKIRR